MITVNEKEQIRRAHYLEGKSIRQIQRETGHHQETICKALDAALTDDDWALLDCLAELTCGNVPDFGAVRSLYAREPRLRVDNEIQSCVDGRLVTVQLALQAT
jgi:hypothetical protein